MRQQRLMARWLISNRRRTVAIARRDEARCHGLAQQGETRGVRAITCRRGAAGVVAVRRGDCDGLAIGDCVGLAIDEELIDPASKLEIVTSLARPDTVTTPLLSVNVIAWPLVELMLTVST